MWSVKFSLSSITTPRFLAVFEGVRVHRRIWWLTVPKAADRSSKISNEDLEAVLASLRSSTTESKAVSVECPLLKPDWLLSRRLFFVKKALTWLNTTRSSDLVQKAYGKQKMASEKSTKTPAVLDVNTQSQGLALEGAQCQDSATPPHREWNAHLSNKE